MGLSNAEVTDHLITVSLALATMAASSSSVISMARLNWVGGARFPYPSNCVRDIPPVDAFSQITSANEPSDHLITPKASLCFVPMGQRASNCASSSSVQVWSSVER